MPYVLPRLMSMRLARLTMMIVSSELRAQPYVLLTIAVSVSSWGVKSDSASYKTSLIRISTIPFAPNVGVGVRARIPGLLAANPYLLVLLQGSLWGINQGINQSFFNIFNISSLPSRS